MADKPSRALVIYGDGFAPLVSSSPHYPHLHSLASRSSCGFLSLRGHPKPENGKERMHRELVQLLDAYDFCASGMKNHAKAGTRLDGNTDEQMLTISQRFMGMKAAIISTCPDVKDLGESLGFETINFDQLIVNEQKTNALEDLPDSFAVVEILLNILGFSGGKVLETPQFDLVFVHVNALQNAKKQLDWLNETVGWILQTAQCTGISSRLHFSLVMGYGDVAENDNECSLLSISKSKVNSKLAPFFPCQSYTMKGGQILDNIRHDHPMLVAQWQDAVTRMDTAGAFSFEEFAKNGANNAILADRFLHEVAFKLWKAPKYGA